MEAQLVAIINSITEVIIHVSISTEPVLPLKTPLIFFHWYIYETSLAFCLFSVRGHDVWILSN